MSTWATLNDVIQWVQIPGDVDDAATPAGSLLAFIGAPPSAHWRALATIPEAELGAASSGWTIGGANPTLWQRALALLAGNAARIAGGAELRSEVKLNNAQAALAIQFAHAQAATAAAQTPTVAPPEPRTEKCFAKVKLQECVDQFGLVNEIEVDDDLHRKGLLIFQKIFRAKPDE